MSELTTTAPQSLAHWQERRAHYASKAKADNTWVAYERCWRSFEVWCATQGRRALPAATTTVADFATSLADAKRSTSTIRQHLAAIGHRHNLHNLPVPTRDAQLREVLLGICRELRVRASQAEPLLPDHLRKLVGVQRAGARGLRDWAVLCFGLAGAFRRSEIGRDPVAETPGLQYNQLIWDGEAYRVLLPNSKTDQLGEGVEIRICRGEHDETCPVTVLDEWLETAGIRSGAVFRRMSKHGMPTSEALSARSIDAIVRYYVDRGRTLYGPDLIPPGVYSAHSLRAGYCTAASLAGKAPWEISSHARHKSLQTTERYIRTGRIRSSTASKGIGL